MNAVLKNPVDFEIPRLLTKGKEAHLVLDKDNDVRVVRLSRIVNVNHAASTVMLAEPPTALDKEWLKKKIILTSFYPSNENPRPNIGVSTVFIGFGKHKHMTDKREARQVRLKYGKALYNADLNGWYDIQPGPRFQIDLKIKSGKNTLCSYGELGYFCVRNLSMTEIGINIPERLKNGRPNPLILLEKGLTVHLELVLKDATKRGDYNKKYRTQTSFPSRLIYTEADFNDEGGYAAFRHKIENQETKDALKLFLNDSQLNKIRLKEDLSPVHHKTNKKYCAQKLVKENPEYAAIPHNTNPELYLKR